MLNFLRYVLSADTLSPHGICLLWRPELIWLHAISDAVIGIAYFSIPLVIAAFLAKRPDVEFHWAFWAFAIFILACGTTHFLSIWTLWVPDYGAEGLVKAVTALASIATAVALWPLLPKALAMPSAAQLRQSERRYRSLVQNASDLVLVCASSGAIVYQSPTAEAAWSFKADELLDQDFGTLIHPDDRPALRDLWKLSEATPGASRSVELRMHDASFGWRCIDLFLTNLLHEPAVEGIVVTARDIHERKSFEEQLTRQAFYDALTGLPNRALLQDRLEQAVVRASRHEAKVGLLFIDLDNFKLINDSLGHHNGDELLKEVAARLQACVREEDTLARLGGDEFVVVLNHLAGEADALLLTKRISDQFERTFILDGREISATASIGIAVSDASQVQSHSLLRNADVAMYRAKSEGKGRHVVFDASMHVDTLARLEMENDLRRGIGNGELRVHYQPIVLLQSGSVAALEALVRWQHPTRGLLLPADFIPLAEETGLIVPLDFWVLRQACRQVAIWQGQFPSEPPLMASVNLSSGQFQEPSLVEEVTRVLRDTGLAPGSLKLEITESVLMQDIESTLRTLSQLKDLGIKLAVDDFGTGYSSLAYLKRLPLDVIKIDRSFVQHIGEDREDTAIVRAIISMAKSLRLEITGEGIETAEQAALLDAWGCDCGQGYYYARPLEESKVAELLRISPVIHEGNASRRTRGLTEAA